MVTYIKYIGGFVMSKYIIDNLRAQFANLGRRSALCSVDNLSELAVEIRARKDSREVSPAVYEKYLKDISYTAPASISGARSVLLVATPIGRSVLELKLEGGSFLATIPPTYGAEDLITDCESQLNAVLGSSGIAYERAWLPLKALAARMGLARYGRDNVLRFEGLGSFVRLDAWWTELEAEGEDWEEPRALERCASCRACIKACPNGCISEDRFVIDASRCLTCLNEGKGPFPEWLDARVHNAVVGCLLCQDACPENRKVPGQEVYRRFVLDREESESLLMGRPIAEISAAAAAAVRAAEMVGCEGNLARNLRCLIAARESLDKSRIRA
jgi:epoxyqueuosine reductase